MSQKGKGRALRKAWLESVADATCYMDVDLSTDLAALEPLARAVLEEGWDVASMPEKSKTPTARGQADSERARWLITENRAGLIQRSKDGAEQVVRVSTQDGELLSQAEADGQNPGLANTERGQGTSWKGRLLRYYFGHGGRRVMLQSKGGSRWQARIHGTRWLPSGREWSFAADNRMWKAVQ